MTIADAPPPAASADVGAELAVEAWRQLCRRLDRSAAEPAAVIRLKRQRREWHKSAVYRLEGVGDSGEAVVAKRCARDTARVEFDVYDRLLPRLPVRGLRCYGCVEEEQGRFAWLFMENAGGAKPTVADRGAVAEWLARLHGCAASLSDEVSLPDRGPNHYRDLLPAARAALAAAGEVAHRYGHETRVIASVAEALDRCESRWDRVTVACAPCPRTLVHADFTRKHIRIRRSDAGAQVVALDWETAGWGPPAVDLADLQRGRARGRSATTPPDEVDGDAPWYGPVPLDVYASALASFWPGIEPCDVERLSRAGSVFRLIDSTCWASRQVESGAVDKGMGMLRAYASDLSATLASLGL